MITTPGCRSHEIAPYALMEIQRFLSAMVPKTSPSSKGGRCQSNWTMNQPSAPKMSSRNKSPKLFLTVDEQKEERDQKSSPHVGNFCQLVEKEKTDGDRDDVREHDDPNKRESES